MHFNSALLAVVCLAAIGVACATYSDCGSVDGSIVNIEVSKCAPNARRCILRRNTNVTMVITFKSNTASDSLKAVVHGVILGVDVPFELPNSDGCKDSGITCPLAGESTYKYVTTMPILGSYPKVTVDIKWELRDSNDKDIICGLIPAKIA